MSVLTRTAAAAALACLAMAVATVPGHAAVPPGAPTAQTPDPAALVQTWLADVAAWTQGYDALTTTRVETLAWLLDSAEVLVERLDTGGSAVATPWARSWAVEARGRLAAEMDLYRNLATEAPAFPASVPTPTSLAARIEVIGRTSDQVGSLMISTTQACEDYVRVIEAAASGKPDDYARIDGARLGLLIAQMESEITMMQAASAATTGPNLHFARSQVTSNRAMIAWLGHNKRLFSGQSVDGAGTARVIRGHLAAMRVEVTSMQGALDTFEAQMASEPGFTQTELGRLYGRIAGSLRESAAVEERMADALDGLAEAVQSDDEAADDAAAVRIEAVANERVALDTARRQMIAQAGD